MSVLTIIAISLFCLGIILAWIGEHIKYLKHYKGKIGQPFIGDDGLD